MTRAWSGILALSLLAFAGSARAQSHPLPKVDAFLDSAGVAALVRAHAGGASGKVLLLVTIDSAGQPAAVRTLESRAGDALAALLADSVLAFVRPQPPYADGRWWVRLALGVGAEPTVRLERVRIDPPRPITGTDVTPELIAALRAAGSADVRYRVLVDRDGTPLRVELGTASAPTVANEVRRAVLRGHFIAGKVEGVQDRMWVGLGARFEQRRMGP